MYQKSSVRIFQSVAILIDGNNIELGVHDLMGSNKAMLDFDSLIPKLLVNRGLNRLIYFREGSNISHKLAERLHRNFHGSVEPCFKSADIPLTIKATQIASKVDTIIILSGDSDFVELVRHLKSEGVRVEIAAVNSTTAEVLKREADYFTPITRRDCFVYDQGQQRAFRREDRFDQRNGYGNRQDDRFHQDSYNRQDNRYGQETRYEQNGEGRYNGEENGGRYRNNRDYEERFESNGYEEKQEAHFEGPEDQHTAPEEVRNGVDGPGIQEESQNGHHPEAGQSYGEFSEKEVGEFEEKYN